MGGAAIRSTQVRPIHIPTIPTANAVEEKSEHSTLVQVAAGSWAREDLRERISDLEQQLQVERAEREAAQRRADGADDELRTLRESVREFSLRQPSSVPREQDSDGVSREHLGSARAQERMIKQLQMDLEKARKELKSTEQSYEQTVKRVKSSSSRTQAESALMVFELKEETRRLGEENAQLNNRLTSLQAKFNKENEEGEAEGEISPITQYTTVTVARPDHTKLVVELSEQVAQLSGQLQQAHDTISRLKEKDCCLGNVTLTGTCTSSGSRSRTCADDHSLHETP